MLLYRYLTSFNRLGEFYQILTLATEYSTPLLDDVIFVRLSVIPDMVGEEVQEVWRICDRVWSLGDTSVPGPIWLHPDTNRTPGSLPADSMTRPTRIQYSKNTVNTVYDIKNRNKNTSLLQI